MAAVYRDRGCRCEKMIRYGAPAAASVHGRSRSRLDRTRRGSGDGRPDASVPPAPAAPRRRAKYAGLRGHGRALASSVWCVAPDELYTPAMPYALRGSSLACFAPAAFEDDALAEKVITSTYWGDSDTSKILQRSLQPSCPQLALGGRDALRTIAFVTPHA